MLQSEKLHIVAYVPVGNIDKTDVTAYLDKVMDGLNHNNDGSVVYYVMPILEDEPMIDCINPKLCDSTKNAEIEESIERIKKQIETYNEKFLEYYGKTSN